MAYSGQGGILFVICLLFGSSVGALPTVLFSASDVTVNEGQSVQLTITIIGGDVANIYIEYTDDTATNGKDYSGLQTVSAASGDTSATLTIDITDDADSEPDEKFSVSIKNDAAYTVAGNPVTVTISRSDQPTFSLQTATAYENVSPFVVTISISGTVAKDTIVSYTIGGTGAGETATKGTDFDVNLPLQVTFRPGVTFQKFEIAITDDNEFEGPENFIVKLTESPDYLIGFPITYTIVDNDPPTVGMKVATLDVAEWAGFVNVLITRPNIGRLPAFDVYLNVDDKTTKVDSDYSVGSKNPVKVSFSEGDVDATLKITVKDDDREEVDETFEVKLNTNTAYVIQGTTKTTVTILNNDYSTISITDAPASISEGGVSQPVTVTRTLPAGGSDVALTVAMKTTDKTATKGHDFSAPADVKFPIPGPSDTSSKAKYQIDITDDGDYEPDETFMVKVVKDITKFKTGSTTEVTITITSDDAPIFQFSTGSTTIGEGSQGTGTVELTNWVANSPDTSVKISSANVDATSAKDYVSVSETLSFSGTASKTFNIITTQDTIDEPAETFKVKFEPGTDTMTNSELIVTITDDDVSVIKWKIFTSSGSEGDTVEVKLLRTNSESNSPEVTFTLTLAGTASSSDYTLTKNVVFSKGSSESLLSVALEDDIIDEVDETLEITIPTSTATMILLGSSTSLHTMTIQDNDVSLINFPNDFELEESKTITFDVTRENADSTSPSVTFALDVSGSESVSDYTVSPTSITFNEGEDKVTVTVTSKDDKIDEIDESIEISFKAASGIDSGTNPEVIITVTDNDLADVKFDSFDPVSEDAGTVSIGLIRTNSAPNSPKITVKLTLVLGSLSGSDASYTKKEVEFPAGAVTAQFHLTITDDDIHEPDENLQLTISGSSDVNPTAPDQLIVTVKANDKSKIEFLKTTMTVDEGDNTITIELTRTNAESNTPSVTVKLSATDITAKDGSDYSASSLTDATFGIGVSKARVTITITDDMIDEEEETFKVSITASNSVSPGSPLTVTITDNDASLVKFITTGPMTVSEDKGTADVEVQRTNFDSTSPEVTVMLTASYNGASARDFSSTPIEVTIASGSGKATLKLPINDDEIHEPSESATFSIVKTATVIAAAPKDLTVTITDNDKSAVEYESTTMSVNEGANKVTVTVKRMNAEPNTPAVMVEVTPADGTAKKGNDFTISPTMKAEFKIGEDTADIEFTIVDDIYDELTETFTLTLVASSDVELGAKKALVVTIDDNDKSIFTFTPATYSVGEDKGSVELTVVRNNINGNAPSGSLTFGVAHGSTDSNDLGSTEVTSSFPKNAASVKVEIPITNDKRDENDETFTVTFKTNDDIEAGKDPTATVTIVDDDKSTFGFSKADYSGKEKGSVHLTIDRTDKETGTTSVDVELEIEYPSGEATSADITGTVTEKLTFGSGITSRDFSIGLASDGLVEKAEKFTYKIKASTKYNTASQDTTTVTIISEDVSKVKFKESTITAEESSKKATVVVERTNVDGNAPGVTVSLLLELDSASAQDLTKPNPFQVTFGDGEKLAQTDVMLQDDKLDEAEEEFTVTFASKPNLYSPHTTTEMTVKIKDDDVSIFSFASAAYSVDEDKSVTLTINRIAPVGTVDVTVNIAITLDTTSADDIASSPPTVAFAAGSAKETLTIEINDDSTDEADEKFTVTITPVANKYIVDTNGHASTVVTIVDNDVPKISLVTPKPTYESTGPLVLTASRTNGLIGKITVDLTFTDGTAVKPQDYTEPNPKQIVFQNGQASASINIALLDDIKREKTKTFTIAIVDDAKSFETGDTKQVTATILDDDGPATFDCRRPGQSCMSDAKCVDGVCDCSKLNPSKDGYKCHIDKNQIGKAPCKTDSCIDSATCVNVASSPTCMCDAGYVEDGTCDVPIYQVVCGEGDMAIQINPLGDFKGKVYAYEHEESCTFDDLKNQKDMPSSFTGGKAKIIPNQHIPCGDTQTIVTDKIMRVYRLIYVQYHIDFQAVFDEVVRARCTYDMSKNIVLESAISPVTASQGDVVQSTAHGKLNPLGLSVKKGGVPLTDSTPVKMGDSLLVILKVSPVTEFGAILVEDIIIDNNKKGAELKFIQVIQNSCLKDKTGLMLPESSMMATVSKGVLEIKFQFKPPKFRNSEDVRIRVTAKLCPASDTTACKVPSCGNEKRRKRSTDKFGNKTVDIVFKISDPDEKQLLNNLGQYIKQSQSTCENQIGTGIIAAIAMMGVLLLLFVALTIVLFFRLMTRSPQSKGHDVPSSTTLPTKVLYNYN